METNSLDIEATWLQSYYEALQFFYWEPQHLGRKKHDRSEFNTAEKVAKHLAKIEVTLNHNISQFFLLAPSSLREEFFGESFGQSFKYPFTMHGRGVDTTFELINSMQPDFMFTSNEELVCIEMKISAKISISQVLKYALLGLAVELRAAAPRRHYLVFLATGMFKDQWQEKFNSIVDLQRAIASADVSAFLSRQPMRFRIHEERFKVIVRDLVYSFVSYERFAAFLRQALPSKTDSSKGAEVYRKVLLGLLSELQDRGLAA